MRQSWFCFIFLKNFDGRCPQALQPEFTKTYIANPLDFLSTLFSWYVYLKFSFIINFVTIQMPLKVMPFIKAIKN